MKPKIRITIVEDLPEMATYLEESIKNESDFNFVSHYKNAEDALAFVGPSELDILIVDIGLPGMSGIELVSELKNKRPELLCIMFTIFDQDEPIFDSLKAGANGYLLKSASKEKIIMAIKEMMDGGSPMSPSIARKVTEYFSNPRRKRPNLQALTIRENEILDLLAEGYLYKEIGHQLNITTGTVKQHIHRMYRKLHVQNRTEAINKLKS